MNAIVENRLEPAPAVPQPEAALEQSIRNAMRMPAGSVQYAESLVALSRHLMQTDGQLAIRVLRDACDIASAQRHPAALAEALTQLAWLLCNEGQFAEAIVRASHAKQLAEREQHDEQALKAVYVLADIAAKSGDFRGARQRLEVLLLNPRVAQGSARQADYLNRLAYIAIQSGAAREAIQMAERSNAIYRALGDSMLPIGLNVQAMALSAAGRHADAYMAGEEALALTPPGQANLRAAILHTLGASANSAMDVVYAGRRLFEAYELDASNALFTNRRCEIRIELSKLHVALNQPRDAITFLEDAFALARGAALWPLAAEAQALLQTAYNHVGDTTSAARHAQALTDTQRLITNAGDHATAKLLEAQALVISFEREWARDPFKAGYAF
jgi:tetratricopeptide (TPR) repeat protein